MQILTCMRSIVYLEVLRSRKYFAASAEFTRKRFLAGMHSNVVHQFVLSLKRPAVARTMLPKTRVGRTLGTADMILRQVGHDVVHGGENLATSLSVARRLVHPQAR